MTEFSSVLLMPVADRLSTLTTTKPLGEEELIEERVAVPGVRDDGNRGAAVDVHDDGILPVGPEVRWPQNPRRHLESVGRWNRGELRPLNGVGRQHRRARRRKFLRGRAIRPAKLHRRQRCRIRERVEIELRIWRHRDAMRAGLCGNSRHAGAIEPDPVEIARDG
jgi:hypothetical protein